MHLTAVIINLRSRLTAVGKNCLETRNDDVDDQHVIWKSFKMEILCLGILVQSPRVKCQI